MLRHGLAPTLCFALLLGLAPRNAHAQDDVNAEARVFFEEGNRHFARAQRLRGTRRTRALDEAMAAYVQSLQIVRSRNALFNAAIVLEELERFDEAFSYLTQYMGVEGLSEADLTAGRERRDALRDRVAVIAVESAPPGAEVRIDRLDLAPVGVTPMEVAVPAGQHRVFLSVEHHENAMVPVNAVVGERVFARGELPPSPVDVRLEAPEGATLFVDGQPVRAGVTLRLAPGDHQTRVALPGRPPEDGTIRVPVGADPLTITLGATLATARGAGVVTVHVNVPATVRVGSIPLGEGMDLRGELPAGRWPLEVSAFGYAPLEQNVVVREGEETTVHVELVEAIGAGDRTLGWAPLWTGVGATMAAGVAFGLSIRAVGMRRDFEDDVAGAPIPCSTDCQRLYGGQADDVQRANLFADVFWYTAAAGYIAAMVLWILNARPEQPPSSATVALSPVPGGGMLSARLRLGGDL